MPTAPRLAIPLALCVLAACAPKGDTASADSPAAATPAASTPSLEEVRRAIDSANARFVDAFVRGDTAGILAVYADDAISMAPNMPAARGRDGIAKGYAAQLAVVTIKGEKLTTEDVMLAGDLAVETGAYDATIQPKGGAEMREQGKYITVWKRQADGTWKIARDIYNPDAPPPK